MGKTVSTSAIPQSLLRELAQLGSPVDLSVAVNEVENQKVEIEQSEYSQIFELESGRVAYRIAIRVTNQLTRPIDLLGVELRTTWDDPMFQWLTPLRIKEQSRGNRGGSYLLYKFPGKSGDEFPYDSVINHYLMNSRRLPGKRLLDGWLLGIGGLMPAELHHRQRLEIPLTIIGSDHAEYSTILQLSTERLEVRTRIVKPATNRYGPSKSTQVHSRQATGRVPMGITDQSGSLYPHGGRSGSQDLNQGSEPVFQKEAAAPEY